MMVISIKDGGNLMSIMEEADIFGPMVITTKVSGLITKATASDFSFGPTATAMMETLSMESSTAMESSPIMMALSMMEGGKMIRGQAGESKHGPMGASTRVSGLMISKMERESTIMLMEVFMKGCSKMGSSMISELINFRVDNLVNQVIKGKVREICSTKGIELMLSLVISF